MRKLGRAFVWLKRIRYRCGYGVHSPFAFEFITCVIYERTPYYAYRELEVQRKEARRIGEIQGCCFCRRIARLLFRLVNRVQPHTIVDAGHQSYTARYLQAAKKNAEYIHVREVTDYQPAPDTTLDFLYLHKHGDPAFVEKMFEACISHATCKSLFVIEDIHSSSAMKNLWEKIRADERVGITFDLYYLGILFFDTSKIKQHYIVNF